MVEVVVAAVLVVPDGFPVAFLAAPGASPNVLAASKLSFPS